MADTPVVQRIQRELLTHPVVMFMEGTPMWPETADSAAVAHLVAEMGMAFHSIDVRTDPELKDGLADFAGSAEIPQLFVNGTLVGGCDTVRGLDESGELSEVLRGR